MRIGVDLDGVVYNFVESFEIYADLDLLPPSSWEFYEDDHGITLERYLELFEEGVNEGYIFRYGTPKPWSVECIAQLREQGHSIHIVTDRFIGRRSIENTAVWLETHPALEYDSLTFSRDKTVVKTDFFIDDRPKNVDALRAAGVRAYLIDEGRSDQVGHPYFINNWYEFVGKVQDGK